MKQSHHAFTERLLFNEPATRARIVLIFLLVAAVVGLKLVSAA